MQTRRRLGQACGTGSAHRRRHPPSAPDETGRRSPRSGTTGQRGEYVVVLAGLGARSRLDSRYHDQEVLVAVGDRLSQ